MMANTKTPADTETPETPEVPEDLLAAAQSMNIHKYEPKPKLGHYDAQVKTLLDLNEKTGFDNLVPILVPAKDAKKHKRWFKESAAVYKKGARVVNGEDGDPQGDGGILFEFILTEPRVVTRKPKPAAATTEDVPTED